MNARTDTTGATLPPLEGPSRDKLGVYGDVMFLAFRSPRHTRMQVSLLRTYFEPAIELGQFRIFRFDDVPRGMFTWGWLNGEAEEKLITGEALEPEDWQSGDRLWIIDLIAPYKGLTASMVRWIMQRGNFSEDQFWFRRVADDNSTSRIVHIDFDRTRLSRVMGEEEFLRGH